MRSIRTLVAVVAAAGLAGGVAHGKPQSEVPSAKTPKKSGDQNRIDQNSDMNLDTGEPRAIPEEPLQPTTPPPVTSPEPSTTIIVPPAPTTEPQPAQPAPSTTVIVPPPPPQQTTVYVQPQPQPPPEQHKRRGCWTSKVFAPCAVGLVVGGGAADFVSNGMSSLVQTGAAWDMHITVGTRSFIAFETGYMGTLNRLENGQGNAPFLMSNSLDTDLRINLIPWYVEPYVFGGVGWNHMSITNERADPQMASLFRNSDEQLLVPAGGGISAYLGRHATLDARATYRAMFNQDILIRNPGERVDQWSVLGRIGYAF
jgi:hypothetical protein